MSVENAQTALDNVVAALASTAALVQESKESERAAFDHLLVVKAKRKDVAIDPTQATLAIDLMHELDVAEEAHIAADKKMSTLARLETDLRKSHEVAVRNLATAKQRAMAPEAERALQEDLERFETFVKSHAAMLEMRREAGANIHGTGFTDFYYRVLEKWNVRQDMGAKR